jgi:hypothetical protein
MTATARRSAAWRKVDRAAWRRAVLNHEMLQFRDSSWARDGTLAGLLPSRATGGGTLGVGSPSKASGGGVLAIS